MSFAIGQRVRFQAKHLGTPMNVLMQLVEGVREDQLGRVCGIEEPCGIGHCPMHRTPVEWDSGLTRAVHTALLVPIDEDKHTPGSWTEIQNELKYSPPREVVT